VLERWTVAVLRARALVIAAWLVVLAAGVFAATQLPGLLATSFAVPGTESERARTLLAEHFDERPEGTFVVVFRGDPSDNALRRRLEGRLETAARVLPSGEARELRDGGGILYGEIATRLELDDAKQHTESLRDALRSSGEPRAWVTGQPAIQHDLDPVLASDLRRGEAVAVPLALAVLVFMFGASFAVFIPFAFAACTIAGTLAAVAGVALVLPTSTYVTNLVALIGFALAVDYSLLIVHRYREELARGDASQDAILRTMSTAGRAVVFSGLAVATGLALLLFVPVPFIRSMGVAGLLVPLVSIAGALTLQPVLLSLVGRRLSPRAAPSGEGAWATLSRWIMRRPLAVLFGGTALLLALAGPALALRVTPGSFEGIPHAPESSQGLELLRDGVGSGAVTPTHVVIDGGARSRPAIERLVDGLARDPEVHIVARGTRPPYVDDHRRFSRVIVVGRHEYGDPETRALVHRLRDRLVPAAGFPAGTTVVAGGAPPQGADFLSATYDTFPWVVLAVLGVTFLVLLVAFRSLVLPLKAVLLNALTVAAVYGVLVLVCQWGVGAGALGLEQTGAVEGWIPVFLFATLFGLSMDYEVFLVARIREAWERTGDNARAVAEGLEQTGRVITAAALIMVAAFAGFVAGRVSGLEQLGLGLALGVLIDATIVRALLVPAFMAVLGRWNWWLPGEARAAPPRASEPRRRP
jgi:RND superfamily putative drug exporter